MVAIEIITKEDLAAFKAELINELKQLLYPENPETKQWLKSRDVRKQLGVSASMLQNLRVNGTLTFTKIGGTVFYRADDINKLFNDSKRGRR